MKRILITLLLLNSFSFAENETMVINNEDSFYRLLMEQMQDIKIDYNLEIEVLITISENGVFSYKILKESDIQKFNEDIIIYLEEQTKIKYPTLKNKKKTTRATFKANSKKEQEILKKIKELKN